MKKSTYSSPMSRYMKFGGDPKLLRAPLSNIGMPLIGFKDGGPLLPSNPSGYADSVINANQHSPFYRDLKAGRAPQNMDFYQNDNSHSYDRVTEDPSNPYVGNSTDFLPHGSYVGYNQWGTKRPAMYERIPQDQSVNPVSRMYIGAGPDNVLQFPSRNAANVFQQEVEKRLQKQKSHQYGGYAQNAASWKHQYGGPTEYAIGGNFGPNGLPIEDDYDPGIIGKPPAPKKYPTDTGVVQQRPPAPWMKKKDGTYMNNTQATANINYGKGSVGAYDPNTGNTAPRPQYPWMQAIGNAATQTVGAGMALGSHINSLNNMRDVHRQSQQMGLTGMQGFQNGQGLKGDYTPNTHMFRPQDMVPANAGMYYPTMGQYGGRMEHGGQYWDGSAYRKYDYASRNGLMEHGGYVEGDEAELDEDTIQKLIKQGYKVQYL